MPTPEPKAEGSNIFEPLLTELREHPERVSPDAAALRDWLSGVALQVADWIKTNRPAIKAFVSELAGVLEKLPEWHANLQSNLLLVERGLEVLRAEGYGGAGYLLSMSETRDLAGLSVSDIEAELYEQTVVPEFESAFLDTYRALGLRPERSVLLSEAIALHREGRFAGSVPLLLSQLEGIVTDGLGELDAATGAKATPALAPPRPLPGLFAKVQVAGQRFGTTEVFAELLKAVLNPSDPQSTVSRTRNQILHGTDIAFATQRRSTQVLLWACAILVQLRVALPRVSTPAV